MMIRLFSITYLLLSLLTSQVFAGGLTSGLGGRKVRVVQNSGGRGQQRPQPSARQIVEIEDDAAEVRTPSQRQNAIDAFLQSQRSAGSARRAPAQQQPRQNQRPHAQSTVGNNTDAELERAMDLDYEDAEENEEEDSGWGLGTLGKAGLAAGILFLGYKLFEMFNSGSAVMGALTAPLSGATTAATPAATPSTTPPSAATGSPSTTATTSASTATALPIPTTPPATTLEAAQHTVVHAHNAAANADAGITEARAMMTRVEGRLDQTAQQVGDLTKQVGALATQALTLFNRFANGPFGAMAGLDDRTRILQIIAENSAASQSQSILELESDDDKTIRSCRMTVRAASKILKTLRQEFGLDYDRSNKFAQSTLKINKLIKMCIDSKNKAARLNNFEMTEGEQRVHDIILRHMSSDVATAIRSNYAGERKKTLRQLGITDEQAQEILREINGRSASFQVTRAAREILLNSALKDTIKIWGAPDSDSDSSSGLSSSDDSGGSTNSDSTESDDSETDDSDSD